MRADDDSFLSMHGRIAVARRRVGMHEAEEARQGWEELNEKRRLWFTDRVQTTNPNLYAQITVVNYCLAGRKFTLRGLGVDVVTCESATQV